MRGAAHSVDPWPRILKSSKTLKEIHPQSALVPTAENPRYPRSSTETAGEDEAELGIRRS